MKTAENLQTKPAHNIETKTMFCLITTRFTERIFAEKARNDKPKAKISENLMQNLLLRYFSHK